MDAEKNNDRTSSVFARRSGKFRYDVCNFENIGYINF